MQVRRISNEFNPPSEASREEFISSQHNVIANEKVDLQFCGELMYVWICFWSGTDMDDGTRLVACRFSPGGGMRWLPHQASTDARDRRGPETPPNTWQMKMSRPTGITKWSSLATADLNAKVEQPGSKPPSNASLYGIEHRLPFPPSPDYRGPPARAKSSRRSRQATPVKWRPFLQEKVPYSYCNHSNEQGNGKETHKQR